MKETYTKTIALLPIFKCFHTISVSGDLDIRIANKYRLGSKIGGGSFGDIYLGKNILRETAHNSQIYNECQTQSAQALALPWKRAHQDNLNNTQVYLKLT